MTINRTRSSADIPEVLTSLGISFEGEAELKARCPSGRHEDRHPSWSIRYEQGTERNGLFNCFSCHWSGDAFDLVMHVRKCGFSEAVEFVGARSSGQVTAEPGYSKPFECLFPPELSHPRGLRDVAEGNICMKYLMFPLGSLFCSSCCVSFDSREQLVSKGKKCLRCGGILVEGRGFGSSEIERFGLRDWLCRRRVWVPVTRHGVLIAWVARSYCGEVPKVLMPKNCTAGSEWGLFGLDQSRPADGSLHLTEGWASCIRVHQAGFGNSIAICGSTLTEQQARDLGWAQRVVVWREGDVAGAAMDASVRGWLGPGRTVETVRMPKGKDPADFPPDMLVKLYEDRR